MKIPKKETMKKYIKNNVITNPCPPTQGCPICTRIRAYRKKLRRTK